MAQPDIELDEIDDAKDAAEARQLDEMLEEEQRQATKNREPTLGTQPPTRPADQSKAENAKTIVVPIRQELLMWSPDGKAVVVANVLVFKDGKKQMLEQWRKPTAEEIKLLKVNGKVLQGGVIGEASSPDPVATEEEKKKANLRKWLIGGAVVIVGGAAAWYAYPKVKKLLAGKRNPDDDMDDADDFDDDENIDDEEV